MSMLDPTGGNQPTVGSDFMVVTYVPRIYQGSTSAVDIFGAASSGEGESYRNAVDEIYGSGSLF